MNSNKIIGNSFETELCEKLSECGWWAHNMAQNQAGQPADVIAVKDGYAHLIDCKFCTGTGFSVRRIEENQRNAMMLWEECGNGEGLFAINICNETFVVTLSMLDDCGMSILTYKWFDEYAMRLEDWLREHP